jgi:hypothetical protein
MWVDEDGCQGGVARSWIGFWPFDGESDGDQSSSIWYREAPGRETDDGTTSSRSLVPFLLCVLLLVSLGRLCCRRWFCFVVSFHLQDFFQCLGFLLVVLWQLLVLCGVFSSSLWARERKEGRRDGGGNECTLPSPFSFFVSHFNSTPREKYFA